MLCTRDDGNQSHASVTLPFFLPSGRFSITAVLPMPAASPRPGGCLLEERDEEAGKCLCLMWPPRLPRLEREFGPFTSEKPEVSAADAISSARPVNHHPIMHGAQGTVEVLPFDQLITFRSFPTRNSKYLSVEKKGTEGED